MVGDNCSIGPFATVGERVRLGRNAVVHPHVVLYEGAEIGDDFLAHSHASVREFCRIGNRVILQNGVVVGGDGFGFAKREDGSQHKIVQSGITVIEDDVEVQSLTSLDRATVGETRIKRGAKIDSLVQVGHACVVGEDNIICAQTGLAGSTVLERNVLLAGQVGSSGHLTVHEGATVYAQSGIGGDVAAGARISGSPAFAATQWLRAITALPKLPELLKTLRELKKRVDERERHAESTPPVDGRRPVAYLNEPFSIAGRSRLADPGRVSRASRAFPAREDTGHRSLFGSARITEDGPMHEYYQSARTLARLLTEWSNQFPGTHRFVVCSGGGPGIMEAANRGARDADERPSA